MSQHLFNLSQVAHSLELEGADDLAVRGATDYLLRRVRDMADDALSESRGASDSGGQG